MSLVDRAKAILLEPKKEWGTIASESGTVGSIFTSYVIPLALIPPICWIIGACFVGYGGAFGVSMKFPVGDAIKPALVLYVTMLASVYVLGLAIDALAPNFGGSKNPLAAFKVAAYSATPIFVAGFLYILPSLGGYTPIGALYGAFLLFLGLPVLMKSPEDKTPVYAIVVIVIMVVLGVIDREIMTRSIGIPLGMMGG